MDLTFLGTGTALSQTRGWSSCIIDKKILFDAPPDVTRTLKRVKISVEDIQYIFITHFHADHYFGIPFLMLEKFYFFNNGKPINLIGPRNIKERIKSLFENAFEDVGISNPNIFDVFNFVENDDPSKIDNLNIKFITKELQHTVSAYGYKIKLNNKYFVYTGDTGYCKNLEELVMGSDVVVAEMSHIDNESNDHLNLKQLLKVKNLMNEGGILFATHMRNEEPKDIDKIKFASDLQTYKIIC